MLIQESLSHNAARIAGSTVDIFGRHSFVLSTTPSPPPPRCHFRVFSACFCQIWRMYRALNDDDIPFVSFPLSQDKSAFYSHRQVMLLMMMMLVIMVIVPMNDGGGDDEVDDVGDDYGGDGDGDTDDVARVLYAWRVHPPKADT